MKKLNGPGEIFEPPIFQKGKFRENSRPFDVRKTAETFISRTLQPG